MKTILFLLLLSTSFIGRAQEQFPLLMQAIKTKRIENIAAYLSSAKEIKRCYSPGGQYIRLHREILPGYFETMIDMFSCEQIDASSEMVSYYRLNILSKDSAIFYYSFEDKYHDSTLTKGVDKKSLDNFKQSFSNFYETELDFANLFNDKITFGSSCGAGGIPTKQHEQVMEFVKERNFQKLQQWLRSPNSELQLYAVYGFIKLNTSGYKLEDNTWSLINYIINKPGNVQSCMGCFFDNRPIKELKTTFDYNQLDE